MEKNRTSSPKAMCEKIFGAITFGPAFSTIHRILGWRPTPAKRPKPASAEGLEVQVPINFDYTPEPKNGAQGGGRVAQQSETPPKPSTDIVPFRSGNPIVPKKPENMSKPRTEESNGSITTPAQQYDTFAAYINEAKRRITLRDYDYQDYAENSSKFVGHGRGGAGKD